MDESKGIEDFGGWAINVDMPAVFMGELMKRLANSCMDVVEEAAKTHPDLIFSSSWEFEGDAPAIYVIKPDGKRFIARLDWGTPSTQIAQKVDRGIAYVNGLIDLDEEELEEQR